METAVQNLVDPGITSRSTCFPGNTSRRTVHFRCSGRIFLPDVPPVRIHLFLGLSDLSVRAVETVDRVMARFASGDVVLETHLPHEAAGGAQQRFRILRTPAVVVEVPGQLVEVVEVVDSHLPLEDALRAAGARKVAG